MRMLQIRTAFYKLHGRVLTRLPAARQLIATSVEVPMIARRAIIAALLVTAIPCFAADPGGVANDERTPAAEQKQAVALKFTPTYYYSSVDNPAWDLNLRGSLGAHNAWVGYYRRREDFQQLRLGYDYTWDVPFGKLIPSVQYATHGFLGGSINAEIGERYFALLGFGRTNLKPYFNLNFDPNDAIMIGAGTRVLPRTTLSLFQIKDDRLHTGQRITHFVTRYKPDDKHRWTVDIFHKSGREDSNPASEILRGTGAAITYDFEPYFVRVASDPYVNFTNNHMVRVAFGLRF